MQTDNNTAKICKFDTCNGYRLCVSARSRFAGRGFLCMLLLVPCCLGRRFFLFLVWLVAFNCCFCC